jgi:HlyD family secretion protein
VFVVKDGKVAKRTVETDIADDSFIAITKGVAAGEQIVVGPARVLRFLVDGERVRAMAADRAAAEAAKPAEKKAGEGVWNP